MFLLLQAIQCQPWKEKSASRQAAGNGYKKAATEGIHNLAIR